MKKRTIIILFGILVLLILFPIIKRMSKNQEPQSTRNEKALSIEQWIAEVKKHNVEYQLLLETNYNTSTADPIKHPRQAAEVLWNIGANLTPHIVENLRTNADPSSAKLFDMLLSKFARIALRWRPSPVHGGNFKQGEFEVSRHTIVSNFLTEWDSGLYNHPEIELEKLRHLLTGPVSSQRIMPDKFRPISYFGIYSLPFLIREMRTNASSEVFALTISKANHPAASLYWGKHWQQFTTHAEKIQEVRNWWSAEHTKFNELHPLYEKIDAAVKALPDLPMETNAVASGASP